jgi:ferredoxin
MRISIDAERCQGHGQCHRVAPELFEVDDDGRGVVITAELAVAAADPARLAADSCPEQAISVLD